MAYLRRNLGSMVSLESFLLGKSPEDFIIEAKADLKRMICLLFIHVSKVKKDGPKPSVCRLPPPQIKEVLKYI